MSSSVKFEVLNAEERRVRDAFIADVVFAALTAVQHYRAGDFMRGAPSSRIEGYDAPLTQNPNDLALMLNLLLPLAVALLLTRPRGLLRAVLIAADRKSVV